MRFLADSDDGLSPLDRGKACKTCVLCLEKYLVKANKGNKGKACMRHTQCLIAYFFPACSFAVDVLVLLFI